MLVFVASDVCVVHVAKRKRSLRFRLWQHVGASNVIMGTINAVVDATKKVFSIINICYLQLSAWKLYLIYLKLK